MTTQMNEAEAMASELMGQVVEPCPGLGATQIITDKEGFLKALARMTHAGCYYKSGNPGSFFDGGNSSCYYRLVTWPGPRPHWSDPKEWWTEGGFELVDQAGDPVCGFPFKWWFDRAAYYCYDLKDGAIKVVSLNDEHGLYGHLEIIPAPKSAIAMIRAKKVAWL